MPIDLRGTKGIVSDKRGLDSQTLGIYGFTARNVTPDSTTSTTYETLGVSVSMYIPRRAKVQFFLRAALMADNADVDGTSATMQLVDTSDSSTYCILDTMGELAYDTISATNFKLASDVFDYDVFELEPGMKTFEVQWKVTGTGTIWSAYVVFGAFIFGN